LMATPMSTPVRASNEVKPSPCPRLTSREISMPTKAESAE
jgi:hypothetical protein